MKRETSTKIFFTRRLLAVLMAILLAVSIIAPNMVLPASADETVTTTNGYYDDNGVWHQGGDGSFTYNDGALTLSKTAKPVEGELNVFEIALQVAIRQDSSIFSPSSIATVLVVDVSNSMEYCAECGASGSHDSDCSYNTGFFFGSSVQDDETRLAVAKAAAVEFLDAMRKDAKEGSGRYVTLVAFATDATKEVASWQDVTTTSGYNTVKNAINNLDVDGGTNLDAGLGSAIELINSEAISSITKGGKNVIVLTDGKPTYYETTSGSTGGNGSDSSKTIIDDTTTAAATLKEKANVFTICYDAESTSTYSGGPTVGNFLKNNIATPATEDITYAYNVENSSELIESFMDIVEIELRAAQVTITDPMPENIRIPEGGLPDGIDYVDDVWSLEGIEPTKTDDGNMVIYTYTIKYKVELDPEAEGIDPDTFYPANKPTQLIVDGGETYDFPVPGIKATPEKSDITFNSGSHGSIEGEDENGNVTFEDVTNGTDTPTPPTVTPDDGWYFVGWSPEISDTVDGDVTYVAQYSQKKVIKVTGNTAELVYNGEEQTVTGYTVDMIPEGWTITGLSYSASATEVSITTEGFGSFSGTAVVIDENGKVVPEDQYSLYTFAGELTILPRELVITTDSATKEYDGTALTDDGWNDTPPVGLADGDEILMSAPYGSQTAVGSSLNLVDYDYIAVTRDGKDVTHNYKIIVNHGTLTVTKNTTAITITADSASKEYDGTALTADGYTFTQGILSEHDELIVVVEGSQTDVGSSANKVVSYKVMLDGEVDVTDYYTFALPVDGTLTVTKVGAPIVITAASDSKTYDGTPLTNGGYTFTQGVLAEGDVLTAEVSGAQTFAGTSANVVASYKVMRGNQDVTANYTIETVDGTLEVTKRGLVITADSAAKIYDGTALTDNGWQDTAPAGLASGDTVSSVVVTGTQTNVGHSANIASGAVIMRSGVDVTANYDITYINGTLTVSTVGTPIIITAASDSKVYDGTPLTNSGYTFTQGVLVEGDELIAVVEGSQTNAGISANKVVSYKVMRNGTDVTSFYTFGETVDGTLEVTKRDVTITAGSATKEYDGEAIATPDYTVDGVAAGEQVSATVTGTQLFVGTSSVVVSDAVITGENGGTTDNYNITYVDGTLTVTKRSEDVTVTADSASKIYDGTPLTADGYIVTGNLADGDELVVVIEGSQTFAGSSANKVTSIKVMRDGVDVTANYANIGAVDGTLTVNKIDAPIIITAGSDSKAYDGTPLTNGTYTITEGALIEGDELVVVIEGSQTEVGSSANKVVSIKVMRGDVDVTDCYNIETPVDGELVITDNPETGDNTTMTLWSVVMIVSLLTLFVLAFTARRKQRAR